MDKAKHFKKIMGKSDSTRVIILTAHYQIVGDVYDCEDCNKDSCVNLVNVRLCHVNNSYDGICEDDVRYDWLHINMDKVIAFSFI